MSANHLHRTTTSTPGRIEVRIALRVNNTSHELSVDSRLTLLDTLRDVLDLTGTKKGAIRARAAPARSSSTASVSCPV